MISIEIRGAWWRFGEFFGVFSRFPGAGRIAGNTKRFDTECLRNDVPLNGHLVKDIGLHQSSERIAAREARLNHLVYR